ncbi:MAG: type I DNA topoisomerase [Eubacteriales bacterium]
MPRSKKQHENKKYDLVIVESSAKAKTINKFLGDKYVIKASNGHVRDLPKSKIGVDIENDYQPQYIQIRGKGDIIKQLKTQAANANKIYLATDPDREGEAISWHIADMLNLGNDKINRIEFNEITKTAVTNAIKAPRPLKTGLINAQQARRVLDRLVGYKLSPFLWHKVKKGLSAGRVQSVAVKIICDREKEITEFVAKEFWTITVLLISEDKKDTVEVKFFGKNGKKVELLNEGEVKKVLSGIDKEKFSVDKIKKGEKFNHPSPPFTTSSLQQEASSRLGFTTKRTMLIAQQLYEGVELGKEGSVGLISYIRTDSVRVSTEALAAVRDQIKVQYGEKYLYPEPRIYKGKKNIQDAHEAIRPTYMHIKPEKIKQFLTLEQFKLYKLIYDRFFASQMADARYSTVSLELSSGGYEFRTSGAILKFKGYLAAYDNNLEDGEGKNAIPELSQGQLLDAKEITPKQNFTQPPNRYTEATLVRMLEEKGIGRPSTYSPIISTIQERGYVVKKARTLYPTDLGMIVNDIVKNNFKDIVDIEFTANLENQLDEIESGAKDWKRLLDEYYKPFEEILQNAETNVSKVELPVEESEEICEKCGAKMVYKEGRFGRFLACPNYPACKNTKAIIKTLDVPCPKCGNRIIVKKTKNKKTFYGCEKYPECDFVSWDMPINEKCEECGSLMVLSRLPNGKGYKKCSNENCVKNLKKKKKDDKTA